MGVRLVESSFLTWKIFETRRVTDRTTPYIIRKLFTDNLLTYLNFVPLFDLWIYRFYTQIFMIKRNNFTFEPGKTNCVYSGKTNYSVKKSFVRKLIQTRMNPDFVFTLTSDLVSQRLSLTDKKLRS